MRRVGGIVALVAALGLGGCANFSAKITGSSRSGSEQLLLTGTSDRAVDCLNFGPLAGAKVFLDAGDVKGDDSGWLVFSLRRAMARQGLLLVDDRKDAQVVVEAAVGAFGTDEVDARWVMPVLASYGLLPLSTTNMQPNAFARRSRQDAVVKLALTAFDARSHRLVWESGTVLRAEALDRRFLGTRQIERSSTLPELNRYPRRGP